MTYQWIHLVCPRKCHYTSLYISLQWLASLGGEGRSLQERYFHDKVYWFAFHSVLQKCLSHIKNNIWTAQCHDISKLHKPVSSLNGILVTTSLAKSVSVKIHWYTPASETLKLEILRELEKQFVQLDVETILPLTVHVTSGVDTDTPICLASHSSKLLLTSVPRWIPVRLSMKILWLKGSRDSNSIS